MLVIAPGKLRLLRNTPPSPCHKQHAQHQQVYGVERVGGVLQGLAFAAVLAVVEPEQRQGQQGEALLLDLERAHKVHLPDEHILADNKQPRRLGCAAAPAAPAREPEQQDHRDPRRAVVRQQQAGQQQRRQQAQQGRQLGGQGCCRAAAVGAMAGPQPGQQRPGHVLVPGVKVRAARHHVKRHLGHDSQQRQPFGVAAQVAGVDVALRQLKREDREGNASDAGHPLPPGDKGGPQMVHQHTDQRNGLELVGSKKSTGGHGWSPSCLSVGVDSRRRKAAREHMECSPTRIHKIAER